MNNVLQLPTKIHELLIVASLSSIALAMFRRRLITDGVRLGFLTGGYRVGDLDYLRTMAFWRQGVDLNRPWEILLAGFVVFATILTIVVGPTEIEAFLSKIFGVYLTEFLARTAVGHRIILKRKEEDNRLVYLELNNQFGRNSGEQELEFVNETYTRNVKTTQQVPIWGLSLNSSLPIDFEVERYGYGSGQTGRTVDFALAIMLIYLAVVAVYATAVGIRHVLEFFHFSRPGRPVRLLSVIPWSDLQDLI
ncbi:hypothetical protein CMUS01_14345, partial [Colletotrichum musicola]